MYPFAVGSRARARHCKHCGQIHHGVAVMLRPLRVRRIQQRALCAPRQLAEARGEKGAQGHGARDFAAALASARIFVAAGGALGRQPSFHAVGAGWACVQRPRRASPRAPTRKLEVRGASSGTSDGGRHLRACKKGRWHGRIM